MRFHFQLEGLLRVRRLLERQARERLDESLLRLQAIEHSLVEARRWHLQTARIRASRNFLPACELQFVESVLHQAQEAIRQCEHRKEEAERETVESRNTFLEARRARKTVSTLREHAFRQFQIEQARREQSTLDEMFLGKLVDARNATSDPTENPLDETRSMTGI
jgi:flagellar export protein FliJ